MNSGGTDRNINAVRLLVGELLSDNSINREDLRAACRSVVYSCFLLEIEPHRLPLSNRSSGALTEYQRREFIRQFFSLYMNCGGERFGKITELIDSQPFWTCLLRRLDALVNTGGRDCGGENDL